MAADQIAVSAIRALATTACSSRAARRPAFLVDLMLGVDPARRPVRRPADTVDYGEVAADVVAESPGLARPHRALADRIAERACQPAARRAGHGAQAGGPGRCTLHRRQGADRAGGDERIAAGAADVVFSLGANLGDRLATLQGAVACRGDPLLRGVGCRRSRDRSGGWAGPADVPERRARRRVHGLPARAPRAWHTSRAGLRSHPRHTGAQGPLTSTSRRRRHRQRRPHLDPAAPPGARARLRPRAVERRRAGRRDRRPRRRRRAGACGPGPRGCGAVRRPLTRWWCADATDKAAAARGHRRVAGALGWGTAYLVDARLSRYLSVPWAPITFLLLGVALLLWTRGVRAGSPASPGPSRCRRSSPSRRGAGYGGVPGRCVLLRLVHGCARGAGAVPGGRGRTRLRARRRRVGAGALLVVLRRSGSSAAAGCRSAAGPPLDGKPARARGIDPAANRVGPDPGPERHAAQRPTPATR